LADEFAPWMLATGPAIHLWFLPFALAASLMVWPVARIVRDLPEAARMGTAAGLTLSAVALLVWGAGAGDLPPPFAQWAYSMPAVALGGAMALAGPGRGLAFLALSVVALAAANWPAGSLQIAFAGAALILCLALPTADTPAARLSAALSLPLYLAHPLVMAILTRLMHLPESSGILAIATLATSLAVVLALHVAFRSRRASTTP
jgi:peptidoglycan/LPS O-acetylase OafA/YrhL